MINDDLLSYYLDNWFIVHSIYEPRIIPRSATLSSKGTLFQLDMSADPIFDYVGKILSES
jgi:hypothetical protein